ncbi:MAG: TIGR01459 family HAD-type hydrolase [Pseudomonadota bacterium]
MTGLIDSLMDIAGSYDAIVLDQWGVLHDGSNPYPHAIKTLLALQRNGARLAVLSNSGKRAAPNAKRIAEMGFGDVEFVDVMTSGEALWRDISLGNIPASCFFPIERGKGDAAAWAEGLDITLTETWERADAVLLMGLPDGATLADFDELLTSCRTAGLPLFCSNPDRKSPRAGGYVTSPGALAFAYADRGGETQFYGKPHRPVFTALASALQSDRLLMIGDSMEHDIAGGQGAGWDTVLIRGGVHAPAFAGRNTVDAVAELTATYGVTPTYSLEVLQ